MNDELVAELEDERTIMSVREGDDVSAGAVEIDFYSDTVYTPLSRKLLAHGYVADEIWTTSDGGLRVCYEELSEALGGYE
jgi:hypothetical protein